MNKYIFSVCPQDEWPSLESVMAPSILEAEEKLVEEYANNYNEIEGTEDYLEFREKMNEFYGIVFSDLYDVEEL